MKKNSIITFSMMFAACVVLAGGGFWWGLHVGQTMPQSLIVQEAKNINSSDPSAMAADFSTFWQAWTIINENYLRNKEVKNEQKVQGSIKGLVSSLGDPYSVFFNPKDGETFQQNVQGNFGGVGTEIGIRNNILTVISPIKDAPADRAGIKAGDLIGAIDGVSTENVSVEDAVSKIRGEIGTKVTLTILREGWTKPKDFSLIRSEITLPTLDFSMKEKGIAYLQLYGFNANVNQLFYKAVNQALAAHARGMILDLRNNPGGYLDVAVDLAGWFVPKGKTVVSEESRQGIDQVLKSNGNGALVDLPLVILINKGSASASEILAGALHDLRATPLVGEQSFGKGTVQQIKSLSDGSSMKITVAHWVLPSGKIIDHEGLKPDVEVTLTDEDVEKKRDPQFDKAMEIILRESERSVANTSKN